MWQAFRNYHFDVYYKGIFLLFAIIFILTLLGQVSTQYAQKALLVSIWSIFYSGVVWLFNDLMRMWQAQMNERRGEVTPNYNMWKVIGALHIVFFLIYAVIFWYLFFI